MNCQKCQSIDANVYMLLDGRRSLSLCVPCYNSVKDMLVNKEQRIADFQLRTKVYLACLSGSGIADTQRAYGVLSTYKSNEDALANELVADIDRLLQHESKP